MKLRIRGNTIRLRLLQSEVTALTETSRVSETISFGASLPETLTYAVRVSENAEAVTAGMSQNEICVILPAGIAKAWFESEQVGIAATAAIGDKDLEILVEKDFVCLTRTDDPDSEDAYPNPDAEC